ncbi:MAG TPA: hypothetical protein VFJ24_00315 [Gaiellales bacterium]|nr:hypothetical protein [Gaiellales bacterium]
MSTVKVDDHGSCPATIGSQAAILASTTVTFSRVEQHGHRFVKRGHPRMVSVRWIPPPGRAPGPWTPVEDSLLLLDTELTR